MFIKGQILLSSLMYLFPMVFKIILRRLFDTKSDANREWITIHNEELCSLYRSPSIASVIKSRRLSFASHNGTLGRPRRRWEDNIIMSLKEIGINTRNWIDSTQDRN